MPKMFSDDDLAVMQRVRAAFDPARAVQPGQGVAHAAAVRRAARQVPAAPAGGGRSDRAAVTQRGDQRTDRRGRSDLGERRAPPLRDTAGPLAIAGRGHRRRLGRARSARSTPCSTPPR